MILLYCYDIEERQRVHNYYRDIGLTVEATPPGEYSLRSYAADADAMLIIGETPPGYVLSLNPYLPLINVGRFQLADAIHFRDYKDPQLQEMLEAFSSSDAFFSYNDVLFGKAKSVLFLGYDMGLTASERAILRYLVINQGRSVSADELLETCVGDFHTSHSIISKHISIINRKAVNIGGRKMIRSPAKGYYRIKKYI